MSWDHQLYTSSGSDSGSAVTALYLYNAGTFTSTTSNTITYCSALTGDPDPQHVRDTDRRRQERTFTAAGWPVDEWGRRKQESAERAEGLLARHLTDRQRASLAERNFFEVRTPHRRYRVYRGSCRNVVGLGPGGQLTDRYCLHQVDWVPDADVMLMQKMLLETQEDAFLEQANRSSVDTFWM